MATPNRELNMSTLQYSSSPDLSSLPSGSPSEPGSPPRQDQRRTSLNAPTGARFTMMPQQSPQQPNQMQEFSLDGVRLTKDGVPRKKPGRKPGTTVTKKASDGTHPTMSAATATASGSGVEAAKPKRPRKPKDPSVPPVPRKKRVQPTSDANDNVGATGLSRSSSANMHFEPKLELTSMRMDIDSRSAPRSLGPSAILHQQPRQPPLTIIDKLPKREHPPSSMMSILNADDSPPRPSHAAPTSTTPVRSVGQSYDPVRSSTYDPVRETMMSRDPYGTGPLGSPRAPSHMTTNRASASPSIASLVDPAPLSHARSPVGQFSITHQHSPPPMSIAAATTSSNNPPLSRYRENVPSLPPSPSPAPSIRNFVAPPPLSSTKPSPQAAPMSKSTSSTTEAAPPMAMISSLTDASRPPSEAALASEAKSTTKKDTNGPSKSSNKPPPPPPVPAAAKTASAKPATTKAAEKAAEKAEKAAEKAAEKKAAAAAKAATKTAKAAAKTASKATAKAGTKSAAATEASSPSSPDAAAESKASDLKTTATSEDVVMSGTESAAPATNAPHIKKFASILQQERGGKQSKAATSAASSPKLTGAKGDGVGALAVLDSSPLPASSEPERSILDFGKALPGDENSVPSIVLHIPLVQGETNTYINFMRLAEDRFGWDALHPRLAAHRDRKQRIAAASAALERNGSGRESGDEMTDDMQSGDEGSNEENGAGADNGNAAANASSPEDAPAAKPARKKRTFKEDEYDRDDDFVDDSEMLWEEQAAASRDGFFVYSGPLVPEEEKPEEGATTPAKRGRGSRGGRGGARSAVGRSAAGRSTTGRGGGPGSRGGTTYRRPRATKQEKEQREREKADLEGTSKSTSKAASKAKAAKAAADVDTSSPFSTSMAIDL